MAKQKQTLTGCCDSVQMLMSVAYTPGQSVPYSDFPCLFKSGQPGMCGRRNIEPNAPCKVYQRINEHAQTPQKPAELYKESSMAELADFFGFPKEPRKTPSMAELADFFGL